jgi:site-specific DNA-cytosine methylase
VGSEGSTKATPEAPLRALWEQVANRAASQGWEQDEQLARELADSLPTLPYRRALENREEALAEAFGFLYHLRQACEAIGIVRNASEPLATAWLAAAEEDQGWAYMAACRGPWVTEWPDVPRVSKGVPARVDRLRCLGNAIVPPIAEWIFRRIIEREERLTAHD